MNANLETKSKRKESGVELFVSELGTVELYTFEADDYAKFYLPHLFNERYCDLHFYEGKDRNKNEIFGLIHSTYSEPKNDRGLYNQLCFDYVRKYTIDTKGASTDFVLNLHETIEGEFLVLTAKVEDVYRASQDPRSEVKLIPFKTLAGPAYAVPHSFYSLQNRLVLQETNIVNIRRRRRD